MGIWADLALQRLWELCSQTLNIKIFDQWKADAYTIAILAPARGVTYAVFAFYRRTLYPTPDGL